MSAENAADEHVTTKAGLLLASLEGWGDSHRGRLGAIHTDDEDRNRVCYECIFRFCPVRWQIQLNNVPLDLLLSLDCGIVLGEIQNQPQLWAPIKKNKKTNLLQEGHGCQWMLYFLQILSFHEVFICMVPKISPQFNLIPTICIMYVYMILQARLSGITLDGAVFRTWRIKIIRHTRLMWRIFQFARISYLYTQYNMG